MPWRYLYLWSLCPCRHGIGYPWRTVNSNWLGTKDLLVSRLLESTPGAHLSWEQTGPDPSGLGLNLLYRFSPLLTPEYSLTIYTQHVSRPFSNQFHFPLSSRRSLSISSFFRCCYCLTCFLILPKRSHIYPLTTTLTSQRAPIPTLLLSRLIRLTRCSSTHLLTICYDGPSIFLRIMFRCTHMSFLTTLDQTLQTF